MLAGNIELPTGKRHIQWIAGKRDFSRRLARPKDRHASLEPVFGIALTTGHGEHSCPHRNPRRIGNLALSKREVTFSCCLNLLELTVTLKRVAVHCPIGTTGGIERVPRKRKAKVQTWLLLFNGLGHQRTDHLARFGIQHREL